MLAQIPLEGKAAGNQQAGGTQIFFYDSAFQGKYKEEYAQVLEQTANISWQIYMESLPPKEKLQEES